MARSVKMLIGAEARYIATTSIHSPSISVNAAETGLHWNRPRKVRTIPAMLTITAVAILA
jgi:hypothetical protein